MISCMNCMTPLSTAQAKFYAECLVCPNCYAVAERIAQRAALELQQLLVTQKELIRVAIVGKQLTLAPATQDKGPDDLSTVQWLASQARGAACVEDQLQRSSNKPTQLAARTQDADGSPSSSSTQGSGSKSETPSTPTQKTEPSDNV